MGRLRDMIWKSQVQRRDALAQEKYGCTYDQCCDLRQRTIRILLEEMDRQDSTVGG